MNVLIYAGSSTPASKICHQLQENLRKILSSAYDIKLVTPQILNNHPWPNHTSLVIFPSLDEGEHDALASSTQRTLREWVGRGGRFMGMGTGARFWASCRDIESQESVVGVWSRYQAGYVALVGFDLSYNLERLIEILQLVGVEGLNTKSDIDLEEPSALYLLSCLSPTDIANIHQNILEHSSVAGEHGRELKDVHNTFTITSDIESTSHNPPPKDSLTLVLCSETRSSLHPVALSLDLDRYFSSIKLSSAFGKTALYGEIVPSTQTLLEKNSKLGDLLPSGTVSIANKQTNGRGRGTNNWISTTGSIQFSVLVKAENLGSSLVFVQYLFGLAVVEWIQSFFNGKLLVRLKWPNDIYGSTTGGSDISDFKKLGGILVNCSFGGLKGTESKLVIGLGLNHQLAPHSTATSLAELIHSTNQATDHDSLKLPSVEETIAGILTCFGQMWNRFELQGFQPFMSLYLSRWLHTDQIIKYEKTGEQLKIIGLDPSFGLLRTKLIQDDHSLDPTNEGRIIDLQPDSNSFDMFSGLIKTKV